MRRHAVSPLRLRLVESLVRPFQKMLQLLPGLECGCPDAYAARQGGMFRKDQFLDLFPYPFGHGGCDVERSANQTNGEFLPAQPAEKIVFS